MISQRKQKCLLHDLKRTVSIFFPVFCFIVYITCLRINEKKKKHIYLFFDLDGGKGIQWEYIKTMKYFVNQ